MKLEGNGKDRFFVSVWDVRRVEPICMIRSKDETTREGALDDISIALGKKIQGILVGMFGDGLKDRKVNPKNGGSRLYIGKRRRGG